MKTRPPLPEPVGYASTGKPPAVPLNRYDGQQMRAYADACVQADNAALRKQAAAYKVVLAGMEHRNISQSREHGLLMQRAADTDGERAANHILTAEVDALQEENKALRVTLRQAMSALEKSVYPPHWVIDAIDTIREALKEKT